MSAPTRRERLRTSTLSEIKEEARRLLVTGGPDAISLRAIAREMGMTAPAIYRYFDSLDALVEALAGDLYAELSEVVATAKQDAGDDPVTQVKAMARAFRGWSVAHPAEFALILGNPLPGIVAFQESCDEEHHPGVEFGRPFMETINALWLRERYATPPRTLMEERLAAHLEPLRASHGDQYPIEVTWAFLSGWSRLYGLVSMEVFHHLRWAVSDPGALFEMELHAYVDQFTSQKS
ncbi:TetR/AcrR family transcriptional regulator [Asanoa siamensis]|uniref:TetR/AcrR family transcriptional regulator n=1 Tax=Asanoa siamensis TaxID=926357 RepID=UPI001944770F|nr:TetR/AcrR family transcriptional regulator [Asanoa siamensis]